MFEPWHGIYKNVVCVTSKTSDQPASLCLSLENSISVKLLTEHLIEVSKFKRRLHRLV